MVWTEENRSKLQLLVLEGKSYSECAKEFDCSRSTIAGAVRRHLKVKGKISYAGKE